MKVAVTGGTGFLGREVVWALRDQGHEAIAVQRHASVAFSRQGIEQRLGSVLDSGFLAGALHDVDAVVHAAGRVSRDPRDAAGLFELHVDGTRRLLECLGGRPMVLVSTSGTVGVSESEDAVADEKTPLHKEVAAKWPYYLSKLYQEELALEAIDEGADIRIVSPALLLGPGDTQASSTGDVEAILRGKWPLVPKKGGFAFVDVRDAARGVVRALIAGESGRRYLLAAANITTPAFAGRIARLGGVASPRVVSMPKRAGAWAASLFRLGGIEPVELEMAQHTWYVDCEATKTALDWSPRPFEETLADTVSDVQTRLGLRGGS